MLKKEVLEDLIKNTKGKIRNVVFQTDAKYVLTKEGESGLEKLEQRVKEMGLSIDYRKAKAMEWSPVGLRIASLLLIKDTFGWTDDDIREMGRAAPKISFIVKFFFKLFLSLPKFAEEAPNYWREHYTEGELKTVKLDLEKKIMVLRLNDYELHPLFLKYLEGYFESVLALTRKNGKVRAMPTTVYKDETSFYYEFKLTWD